MKNLFNSLASLIDSFVLFFENASEQMQFGVILILAVTGLLLLVSIFNLIKFIIKAILKKRSKEAKNTDIPAPGSQNNRADNSSPVLSLTFPEKRTIACLEDDLRKFHVKVGEISVDVFKEEKGVPHSNYSIADLSSENDSHLSDKKKKEIKSRFHNLSLKDLKKQEAAYSKSQDASRKHVEEETAMFRALLLSRDKAENDCTSLYEQHKNSLTHARTTQEIMSANLATIDQDFSKMQEELGILVEEKERLYAEFEANKKAINEKNAEANKAIITAHGTFEASQKSVLEAQKKCRQDTAAYLGSVSEFNTINNSLFNCLKNHSAYVKQNAEDAFALACIRDTILAVQAEIEEKKRLEAEKAEKLRQEKEAERERERERIRQEKQKAKEEAILQAKQEITASNDKAEHAMSKAEALNQRAEALKEETSLLEAKKQALREERERERAEKEAQKAAAKAEKERKEAELKAQKEAQERASLEALEEITEEEKELRRKLEQMNSELPSRSQSAAEEGFVDAKRLNEIIESREALEKEQAKRIAEKEAARHAIEKNQKRIIKNNEVLSEENVTPEERMEAMRDQWRLERENKEKFEAEQARKAREAEERKKALSNSNNTGKN